MKSNRKNVSDYIWTHRVKSRFTYNHNCKYKLDYLMILQLLSGLGYVEASEYNILKALNLQAVRGIVKGAFS